MGRLNAFDFVVLVTFGSVAAGVLNNPELNMLGVVITVGTLGLLNIIFAYLALKSNRFRRNIFYTCTTFRRYLGKRIEYWQRQYDGERSGFEAIMNRHYFSTNWQRELFWRRLIWVAAVLLALALIVLWEPLRHNEFIVRLNAWTRHTAVYYLFRAFTFIGEDEGHVLLITAIYWCMNKSLGFRAMLVLLFAGIYTHFLKEAFAEPRPDVPGVELLDSHSFPSGHTLSVMAVWGYLAVRLQHRIFWICAAAAVALVGLSRMVLGVHFPGDIIGGLLFGFLFLVLVFGLRAMFGSRGFRPHLPFPVLLGALAAIFALAALLAARHIPGEDPLKVVGFLAGTSLGYVMQNEWIRFNPQGRWYQHALKLAIGLVVLLVIVNPLKAILPPGSGWDLARYTLAGLWATCLAPLIFTLTGLAAREPRPDLPEKKAEYQSP